MTEIIIYCCLSGLVGAAIHTWGYCKGLKDAEKIWKGALIDQRAAVLEIIREISKEITKPPKGPNDN
jgi:hypothetical protein